MTLTVCGGVVVHVSNSTESQLDRVVRRICTGWRKLLNTLNQPGRP